MMPRSIMLVLICAVSAVLLSSCCEQSGVRRIYILTTGTTGGTYYPVELATVFLL